MITTRSLFAALLLCLFLGACDDNNNKKKSEEPEPPAPTAVAREATEESDLLLGPLARSTIGDFVLENELFRAIIQQPGRNWFGVGTYGGNIIDVARKQADGSFLPDHLEEFVSGINIENTPNYIEVEVSNPGADGEAAQICARGPDDLLELINASSIVRDFGLPFPASADDLASSSGIFRRFNDVGSEGAMRERNFLFLILTANPVVSSASIRSTTGGNCVFLWPFERT